MGRRPCMSHILQISKLIYVVKKKTTTVLPYRTARSKELSRASPLE